MINTREEVKIAVKDEAISKIMALEAALLALPQVDIPLKHTFCGGMYARAAFMKKGETVTGAFHKQANLNIMVSGDITVVTDEGGARLTGFNIVPSKAGVKRAAHVHEDTIWITILRTDLTDVAEVERLLVTTDYAEILKLEGN